MVRHTSPEEEGVQPEPVQCVAPASGLHQGGAEPSAAFTPGPWRAMGKTGERIYRWPDPHDEYGTVEICRVGAWNDRELIPYNGERWTADARLIAAAPQLVGAVAYVADHTYFDANGNVQFKPGYDPQVALDAIQAATGDMRTAVPPCPGMPS
jgi:hypothetical protein